MDWLAHGPRPEPFPWCLRNLEGHEGLGGDELTARDRGITRCQGSRGQFLKGVGGAAVAMSLLSATGRLASAARALGSTGYTVIAGDALVSLARAKAANADFVNVGPDDARSIPLHAKRPSPSGSGYRTAPSVSAAGSGTPPAATGAWRRRCRAAGRRCPAAGAAHPGTWPFSRFRRLRISSLTCRSTEVLCFVVLPDL